MQEKTEKQKGNCKTPTQAGSQIALSQNLISASIESILIKYCRIVYKDIGIPLGSVLANIVESES